MKKLLALLFVAAMCMPCYGIVNHNILVYTTSATATLFDLAAPARSTETEKGFLVIDIDLDTQLINDAAHVTYGGSSQEVEGVGVTVFDEVTGYIVVYYEDADSDAMIYGTAKQTDVGLGSTHKKLVAASLGGHLLVNNAELGSGTMNATLDTTRTKAANAGAGTAIADVVAAVEAYLVGKGYYYEGYIQARIDAASPGDTITISAGTYHESILIDVDNLTLKSASGAAATIIDPGADFQQAVEISGEHVTIDGFTIKHGTHAYDGTHPKEHTIWVHNNYSTIKNCTIIGAGNSQACIFIGDRETLGGTLHYDDGTPSEGHTIQNNTFRWRQAGTGWGIYALNLTDDCLIKGNKFNGDAADVGHFDDVTNEGAPGTGIIIQNATKGGGDYAVTIRDNTAQYIKYVWLTFTPTYPYNLANGDMWEQPDDSTVEDVNICYNTVHNLGKDALHKSGVAIKFADQDKDPAYGGAKTADLTIGGDGVTIRNNALYNNALGVYIEEPSDEIGGDYGCVLGADNITIGPNNSIYNNFTNGTDPGAGVYNGTIEANQDAPGAVIINAQYNWWGNRSGPYQATTNLHGLGNQVSDNVDYAHYW